MRILSYSDWKQRVAFDNVIYKEAKRFTLTLSAKEREIMNFEIDYYRKHFSLLQVMKHFKLLKTAKDKEIFIKAVLKRLDNILYLPHDLNAYFKKKIKTEFSDYSQFFNLLLDKALEQSDKNNILPLYKTVLGAYYKPVLRKVNKKRKEREIKAVQKAINPAGYENKARVQIGELQDNLHMATIFGRSQIRKSVPVSVVDEYGYGEWKSKNISYGANRFFLYTNHNKLTDKQLEHMVYFNVYPGYAHLYNTVVDIKHNNDFDTGATFLINGWAMYSMKHATESMYANNMLIEGSIITHYLLKNRLEKSYHDIYLYLLTKYTKEKAISYMLDYSQYPGHYLSYVLGAFAIESAIEGGFATSPIDFLYGLSQINCGDFFAIMTPKMQRKLYATNITAKVVKRFAGK